MLPTETVTVYNCLTTSGTGKTTWSNNKEYYRSVVSDVLVNNKSMVTYNKTGEKNELDVYLSFHTVDLYLNQIAWLADNSRNNYFTLQRDSDDFIVIGECDIEIDTTSLESVEESIALIRSKYKVVKIKFIDEKLRGMRAMQHIEVGGV